MSVLEDSSPFLQVSPAAVDAIKRLQARQSGPVQPLRLGVEPGGCAELIYVLHFDPKVLNPNAPGSDDPSSGALGSGGFGSGGSGSENPDAGEGDRLITIDAIEIVVDAASQPYVQGITLDYSEDLMGGGFRFHNPRAARTCSCGFSFSLTSER